MATARPHAILKRLWPETCWPCTILFRAGGDWGILPPPPPGIW